MTTTHKLEAARKYEYAVFRYADRLEKAAEQRQSHQQSGVARALLANGRAH